MPAPRPETARNEPALHIRLRPFDARAWPVICINNTRALVRLIRILLVVSRELDCKRHNAQEGKYVVGNLESAVSGRNDGGIMSGYREEEKKYVLDDRNKGNVKNLEKPFGNFGPEDVPTVIFVFTGSQ